ncbi:STAS domain-containing protein [Magnetospirillum sp. J10]|uniref:STAS domain-containing protein n=2 Tax=Magnetospirillum sulfuroxidans TaxID=611300 RepID=A0ABS5I898_9PROT|nr:STAS domain-containing protein [Magnetospirillum sulfuroxidans]
MALFPSQEFDVLSFVGPQGKRGYTFMEINEQNGRLVIELPAVLDLPAAAEIRDLLIDAAARDTAADVILNFHNVDRISTAAIQVTLAAAAALRLAARRLEAEAVSPAVVDAFRNLGLASDLDQLLDT